MLKKPNLSILIEPGLLDNLKMSLFENDKLVDSHVYCCKEHNPMERLQFLLSDLLSLLAPEMKDTDEEAIYIVRCPGLDHEESKRKKNKNYTFSGTNKH